MHRLSTIESENYKRSLSVAANQLDCLQDAKIFTMFTLNLKNGFFHVKIDENRKK